MKVRYRFREAETPEHFEQIFRLNHEVFAGELEQYAAQPGARLVDRFHSLNRYVIALFGDQVVGMIAVNDQPPFSVTAKLVNGAVLDGHGRLLEVRLLAVDSAHRNGVVMAGLMLGVYQHAQVYDSMVISAHFDKLELYRELGFVDLGPPVPSGQALYVPMVIGVAKLAERQARWQRRFARA